MEWLSNAWNLVVRYVFVTFAEFIRETAQKPLPTVTSTHEIDTILILQGDCLHLKRIRTGNIYLFAVFLERLLVCFRIHEMKSEEIKLKSCFLLLFFYYLAHGPSICVVSISHCLVIDKAYLTTQKCYICVKLFASFFKRRKFFCFWKKSFTRPCSSNISCGWNRGKKSILKLVKYLHDSLFSMNF